MGVQLSWKLRCHLLEFLRQRHKMETLSALLAICAGISSVTDDIPAQRPVTWSFDVFFELRPNKRLSKLWGGWWFEMPSRPLLRHCNNMPTTQIKSNQIFYSPHKIHMVHTWYICTYTNDCFIWMVNREARRINLHKQSGVTSPHPTPS